MGQACSQHDLFVAQLKESLKVRKIRVRKKDLNSFFTFVFKICPWFPQEGSIDSRLWHRVGDCLNDYYKVFGPETVPITAFNYYNLIADILKNHNNSPDIQRLCKEGQEILRSHSPAPSKAPSVHGLPDAHADSLSRPPSRAPSNCPSVSIQIDTNPPAPSLHPPLQEFYSSAPPPVSQDSGDQLDPSEQAELEDEAARYNNPGWPPLVAAVLPPFKPPPYSTSHAPAAAILPSAHGASAISPAACKAPITLPLAATAAFTPLPKPFLQETLTFIRDIKTIAKEFSAFTISPPPHETLAFPVTRSQTRPDRTENINSSAAAAATPLPDSDNPEDSDSSPSDIDEAEPSTRDTAAPQTYFHTYKKLSLKTLEKVKSAVTHYGPTAPFSLALIENLSERWLTPNDWFFLAKAALSGGDFILWKSEYEDTAKQFVQRNMRKSSSKNWTILKFLGSAPYQSNEKQAQFPPGLLTQIQSAGLKAWRRLPQKGTATTSLAKIRQGPDEPYSDFISRLQELAERLFGAGESENAFVKHLAYENANPACQNAIRPYRQGELCDYVRLCSGIGSAHAFGLAIGAALQNFMPPQPARPPNRLCYNCNQPGHFSRACPQKSQNQTQIRIQNPTGPSTNSPGAPATKCPRCKKGFHWSSECRSKTDIYGQPIPPKQGNSNRAQPQGPIPGVNSGATQFTPQSLHPRIPALPVINHAATSQTCGGPQQAAQDWTSVPPPTQY